MDVLSQSDPVCVVKMMQPGSKTWHEIGRTEIVKDNANPKFSKTFILDYYFEMMQPIQFEVYDQDNNSSDTSRQDFIGAITTSLGQICGSPSCTLTQTLKDRNNAKTGVIIVRSEEQKSISADVIRLEIHGHKLLKMDWFGLSDPYLCISKKSSSGEWLRVHQTEIIKLSLNPLWPAFDIPFAKLCDGQEHAHLLLQVYDWNRLQAHELMGEVQTSLYQLKTKQPLNLVLKKHGKDKPAGQLIIRTAIHIEHHSFLEFIAGGLQLEFCVGIDFTGSNGNPQQPNSLHFLGGQVPNEYERAITAIGSICAQYSSNQLYPAFGFGAKLPNGQVSHCFALNGNGVDPRCKGIDGVLAAYKQALFNVQLHGPTWFNQIIAATAAIARQQRVTQADQRFYCLLLLTDGQINDMTETMQQIIRASNLPFAIIIVGVGQANFEAMDALDSDGQLLQVGTERAQADIVQFVPFRKFAGDPVLLAKETLAELPGQITSYFKRFGIKPNPKPEWTYSDPSESFTRGSSFKGQPASYTTQTTPAQAQPQQPQADFGRQAQSFYNLAPQQGMPAQQPAQNSSQRNLNFDYSNPNFTLKI